MSTCYSSLWSYYFTLIYFLIFLCLLFVRWYWTVAKYNKNNSEYLYIFLKQRWKIFIFAFFAYHMLKLTYYMFACYIFIEIFASQSSVLRYWLYNLHYSTSQHGYILVFVFEKKVLWMLSKWNLIHTRKLRNALFVHRC